jgi:hypothetical protein
LAAVAGTTLAPGIRTHRRNCNQWSSGRVFASTFSSGATAGLEPTIAIASTLPLPLPPDVLAITSYRYRPFDTEETVDLAAAFDGSWSMGPGR